MLKWLQSAEILGVFLFPSPDLYFHCRPHHGQLRWIICGRKIACFVQLVFVAFFLLVSFYLYNNEPLYACNNTEQKTFMDQMVSTFNAKMYQQKLCCVFVSKLFLQCDQYIKKMYQHRLLNKNMINICDSNSKTISIL